MTTVDALGCDSHIQLAVENVQHSFFGVFLCFWDPVYNQAITPAVLLH